MPQFSAASNGGVGAAGGATTPTRPRSFFFVAYQLSTVRLVVAAHAEQFRSLIRGEYFARSAARCPHGPALISLSSFASLTSRSPFGSHFRPGSLGMGLDARGLGLGACAGPHEFVRSCVLLVCGRWAGLMLLACVGTLADLRAWRMWPWRAPGRRPLWIRVPPC